MNDSASAYAVSVEVAGRQRYLFETDKLREMLGASLVLRQTVDEARRLFGEAEGLHLFSPVSGEIRAWAPASKRGALLDATWSLLRWLDDRGIDRRVALLETEERHFLTVDGDLRRDVHEKLNALARQSPQGGYDARPTCSLFANCRMIGIDPANVWAPGQYGDESRRELMGYRAKAKLDEWHDARQAFYRELLLEPVARRAGADPADLRRKVTFRDLADRLDDETRDDQYIAFVCADGDGTGTLLGRIDWNSAKWNDEREPWQRNSDFAEELDTVVHSALAEAIAKTAISETELEAAAAALSRGDEKVEIELQVLPQLRGGEDVWVVANRAIALELAINLEREFRQRALEQPTLRAALEVAGKDDDQRPLAFTISSGIAFAKSGLPAHAMIDAAESLLRSAKNLRREVANPIGCLDWHWIQSSLAESVDDARRTGYTYLYSADPRVEARLTSLPWTADEAETCIELANRMQAKDTGLARRKREQIDAILRYGNELSDLAWTGWWSRLGDGERQTMAEVREQLPTRLQTDVLSDASPSPWRRDPASGPRTSPYVDLVTLTTKVMPRSEDR